LTPTRAGEAARAAGVEFELLEYDHDPRHESYGAEALEALGLDPSEVFKTLVAQIDNRDLVVAIVPVNARLDFKALAAALGGRRAAMVEADHAERATGYVLGGISPLGQRRQLTTVLDASAEAHDRIHVSAGRRGMEIALAPADLVRLTDATVAPIARG
jgi:Cys-tRNA(Pro)/Cys-tRNA(Cys) deacylase